MRLANSLLALLSTAAIATACAPAAPDAAAMVAGANAVDSAFQAAFNAGDIDAVMATYWNSPDLVFISLDGVGSTGAESVRADMAGLFASMPGATVEFINPHNVAEGSVVLGWGGFRITMPGDGGVVTGRYSDVKAMRDGKWVYLMDHASVPLPPPAAEGTE